MKIHIDEIPPEGLSVDLEEDGNRLFQEDPELSFEEKIVTHLSLYRVERFVNVSGKIGTKISLQCARCLEKFSYVEDAEFAIECRPASEAEQRGEVHLSADEMDVLYYRDDVIDIDELVMGQVAEIIPAKPLCREDCRGICPQCGQNLNRRDCGCTPETPDPRFAKLKELFKNEE
jgi:uncharacterized protein